MNVLEQRICVRCGASTSDWVTDAGSDFCEACAQRLSLFTWTRKGLDGLTRAQILAALDDVIDVVLLYCDDHYTEVRPGVAAGENLPELLREALERAAESRSAEALIRHRPGAWEADWLMRILGYERDWQSGGWTGPGDPS